MAVGDSIRVSEGTGKRIATGATYTENSQTVQDEKAILGEPYLASYTAGWATLASLATVNAHLLQIMAGASLKVRIRRVEVGLVGLATTAAIASLNIYRLTSAGTGGTAQTPSPLDPADSASGATVMSLPTAKGTEGVKIASAWPIIYQTVGASTISPVGGIVALWDFDRPRSKPLVIAAGAANGIAIKSEIAIAGASVAFNVWFDEVPF